MKANSFTEFQQLEEVILGKAYSPDDVECMRAVRDNETVDLLQQIFRETEEDIQVLETFLEDNGVTVRRPTIQFDMEVEKYLDGNWRPRVDLHQFGYTFPTHPLMPRDTAGVYGNTIVEFFTKTSSRYFENWSYQNIFTEYYDAGSDWISMPTPMLEGKPGDESNRQYDDIQKILYHAANILKCGKDIFYTGIRPQYGQGKGTERGLEWIKRVLGREFTLHPIHAGGHADGKMAIIKPGLVMCWNPDVLPDKMKGWDVIQVPDTSGHFPEEFKNIRKRREHKDFIVPYMKNFIGYCDETVFDVNCFSVNEELLITNGYHKETADNLKSHGVTVYPWHFRHQWFWDGAVHCLTMDTKRKGGQEDYF